MKVRKSKRWIIYLSLSEIQILMTLICTRVRFAIIIRNERQKI